MSERSTFRFRKEWIRHRPDGAEPLWRVGLEDLDRLSARDLGEVVTDRRTSWVRRIEVSANLYYVKTYDYPTASDRRRGIGRTTAFARSRARREWDALAWLGHHGFVRPDPIAVIERRARGLLRKSTLVTAAWDGAPLDRLLLELGAGDRDALLIALARTVERLHDAGFRDRNLDLRNLLGRRTDDGSWLIAKLDSPRFKLRPPHRIDDRLAREDRARLTGSLISLGLEWPPGLFRDARVKGR